MPHIQNYKALSHRLNVWRFQPTDPLFFLGIPATLRVFRILPFLLCLLLVLLGTLAAWWLRNRPDKFGVSLMRFVKAGRFLPVETTDDILPYSHRIGSRVKS